MSDSTTYRWNTSEAAEAFDRAAEVIHPFYLAVQEQVLAQLPFAANSAFIFVDLGGGSGRLAERVLDRFPRARAVLIDQSEPFLALAEQRLERFGPRATLVQRRLQDDWATGLPTAPQAIVSTSAIHHLQPTEKRTLFGRCREALDDGGVFINGDEYRPADDSEYRVLLEEWSAHMVSALEAGRIPDSFRQTLDQWRSRNIEHFGMPKKSGDDFLETIAQQREYLRDAGFTRVEVTWAEKLWAVLVAGKDAQ